MLFIHPKILLEIPFIEISSTDKDLSEEVLTGNTIKRGCDTQSTHHRYGNPLFSGLGFLDLPMICYGSLGIIVDVQAFGYKQVLETWIGIRVLVKD